MKNVAISCYLLIFISLLSITAYPVLIGGVTGASLNPSLPRVKLGSHPDKVIISSQGKHANFTEEDESRNSTSRQRKPHFDSHCNYLSQKTEKTRKRRDWKKDVQSAFNARQTWQPVCTVFWLRLTFPPVSCLDKGKTTLLPRITFKTHWSVHLSAKLCHSATFAPLLV